MVPDMFFRGKKRCLTEPDCCKAVNCCLKRNPFQECTPYDKPREDNTFKYFFCSLLLISYSQIFVTSNKCKENQLNWKICVHCWHRIVIMTLKKFSLYLSCLSQCPPDIKTNHTHNKIWIFQSIGKLIKQRTTKT